MASPIEFAKNHILNEIDDEVLAFSFNAGYNNEIIGTMSILENKIIRNIVIRELNMLDGEEKRIPFTACRVLFHGNDNMLIEIPAITLNNRPIITVNGILFSSPSSIFNSLITMFLIILFSNIDIVPIISLLYPALKLKANTSSSISFSIWFLANSIGLAILFSYYFFYF
jgi:hypothetical protein